MPAGGGLEDGEKPLRQGVDLPHVPRVQEDPLAGGAEELPRGADVVRQGLQVPVGHRRDGVGEAELVAPADQGRVRPGQGPGGPDRLVAAPDHHGVGDFGEPLQALKVCGGYVKDVDEVPEPWLQPHQLPEQEEGGSTVLGGELQNVDVPRQQALHHAVGGQAVHVAGGHVEQHPQGHPPPADGGPARGRQIRQVLRPQLHRQLIGQSLPLEEKQRLPEAGRVDGEGGKKRLKDAVVVPRLRPAGQGVTGGDHRLPVNRLSGDGLQAVRLQPLQQPGQLPVLTELSAVQDHGAVPPFRNSAAPAAQVTMSRTPTRPRISR